MTSAQKLAANGTSTFGSNYAVLNLDFMEVLIAALEEAPEGQRFISNCSRWNDAVHKKESRPLTIFTSLSFSHGEPELASSSPFSKLLTGFGSFVAGSAAVQIASKFTVDEKDVVLQKTRLFAGAGNSLEQILRSRHIDTVIISGITLSGVVMSTIYRLFDLDYNIYVISDNVLELPLERHADYAKVMLGSLVPKMNLNVITIEEALERSSTPIL